MEASCGLSTDNVTQASTPYFITIFSDFTLGKFISTMYLITSHSMSQFYKWLIFSAYLIFAYNLIPLISVIPLFYNITLKHTTHFSIMPV